jgi:SAM-dependent methyltransferase
VTEPQPFGAAYARAYDALYADKDYAGECDALGPVLASAASILDIGCGTGSHAAELARRGKRVTAVDRSPAMLDIARAKTTGLSVELIEADARTLDLGTRTFDAAILMFAVIGYLTNDDDLARALSRVRRHLPAGAPLAFDFWFGPAVLNEPPGPRAKVVRGVERRAAASLDLLTQVVHVEYELVVDGALTREVHPMRFFFPREVALLLERAGFRLERLSAFPSDSPPNESTYTALAIARAV